MVVLISNGMIFDAAGPDRISPHNPFVAEVPPSDNPGLKLRAYRALQLCHTRRNPATRTCYILCRIPFSISET